MKIVRFQRGECIHYGFLEEDYVIEATGSLFDGLEPTSRRILLTEVTLRAPIDPTNIYCLGLNYRQHATETGVKPPERPLIFLKTTTTVIGPGESIVLPAMDQETVDYEAELAIVIGKRAKNVKKENALDYVLGYTCANDVSARSCQLSDKQWARSKSFDTFCPIGPTIETHLDPDNAPIRCRLNGKIMQDSNTSDMIFNCSTIVSYLSHCATLLPGTLILTGTPPGVGFVRKPPVYLRPGDKIEVEIEGIGVLANLVIMKHT
jgi:2-keto-4-pentenoate hydratase/2-oxohepta-3-ene-1,7-dioic acid hydratase in catechol pathway